MSDYNDFRGNLTGNRPLPNYSFMLEYGDSDHLQHHVKCTQCGYIPPGGLQFTFTSQRINIKEQSISYFFDGKCAVCEHVNKAEIELGVE